MQSQLAEVHTLSWQLIHELYDPAGNLADPQIIAPYRDRFTASVLSTYGVELDSPELLPALLCDAVESGLDDEGMLLKRARRVIDIEKLVVPSLQAVTERARQQASDILSQLSPEVPPHKRTLVASDAIAQRAYNGKNRKTGVSYYSHPQQVAAMMLHVFNKLEEEGYTVDQQFKDMVLCVGLLHDATEETVRSCKYYDPNRPEGFSPLLVRHVFQQTGNSYGRMAANSLRLMTHYAEQPWAPTYPRYISLGSSDFVFCLAKSSDMWHNLHIEPKPINNPEEEQEIRDKQAIYSASIELLSKVALQLHADNPKNTAWAKRYYDILRTIEPQDMPSMVEDLTAYIYGDQRVSSV